MDRFSFFIVLSSFFNYNFLTFVLVVSNNTNLSQASFGEVASWICPIMLSCTLTDSQYIIFLALWFQSFTDFNSAGVAFASGIWGGATWSPSMYSQQPLPIRKLVILNFHAWRLSFSSFLLTIVEIDSQTFCKSKSAIATLKNRVFHHKDKQQELCSTKDYVSQGQ